MVETGSTGWSSRSYFLTDRARIKLNAVTIKVRISPIANVIMNPARKLVSSSLKPKALCLSNKLDATTSKIVKAMRVYSLDFGKVFMQ